MVGHSPAKFGDHSLCGSGDVFNLPHDLARPLDSRAMRLYRWEPLKVTQHPAKFGGNKHCGNGDIMASV